MSHGHKPKLVREVSHLQCRDYGIDWGSAIMPIIVGLLILMFSDRFNTPSWKIIFGLPNKYGFLFWGSVLIVGGVAMAAAMAVWDQRHGEACCNVYITAQFSIAFWWLLLSALALVTTFTERYGNPIGVPVFGAIGLFNGWWAWRRHR